MKILTIFTLLVCSTLVNAIDLPRSESAKDTRLYIISPSHGEIVNKIITVKFGLNGMGVAPASLDKRHTGHHHLMVDKNKLPAFNRPIGGEAIHLGGGQTETTIELTPGEHTLQLILANFLHIPHKPPVISEKITVFVK